MSPSVSSEGSPSRQPRGSRRHHRSHIAAKSLLILHILNASCAFIPIILFVAILPLWSANFFHASGMVRGDWPDALPILPLSVMLGTSLTYLVRHFISKRRGVPVKSPDSRSPFNKTPHDISRSRIYLYLRLTTLILLLTFLILAGVSGVYRFWRPAVISSAVNISSGTASTLSISFKLRRDISNSNPTTLGSPANSPAGSATQPTNTVQSCSLANVFTRKCNPTLYVLGDLQIAAITIGAVAWVISLILFVLQAREHQYRERKHARSLRANAKAKMLLLGKDSDISWAERGFGYASSEKRGHRTPEAGSRDRSASDSRSHFSSEKDSKTSGVTRPKRAYTTPSSKTTLAPPLSIRPKQHHYDPEIPHSKNEAQHDVPVPAALKTSYTRAVEEARKKIRPTATMRDWLAARPS